DHRALHSFPTRRSSDLAKSSDVLDESLKDEEAPVLRPCGPRRCDRTRLTGRRRPPGLAPVTKYELAGPEEILTGHAMVGVVGIRSEEHTSELQSLAYLV